MNSRNRGLARLGAAVLAIVLMLSLEVPALAETFSAIVAADSMTVYRDARLSDEVATLEKDSVVRVVSYSGSAAKIKYDGHTGYARVADMKAVDAVAAKAVANEDAKVYQTPSTSARSAKVRKGTKLYVLSWTSEWAEVEKDGVVGYIKLASLTKANDDWSTDSPKPTATPAPTPVPSGQKGVVTSKTLSVYKKASSSSGRLGKLKKGQTVNVISWEGKWAYVELNGSYGYCLVKNLTRAEDAGLPTVAPTGTPSIEDAYPGTVTASELIVYKTASKSGSKLLTLSRGAGVNVIKWNGSWAFIEYNGTYGFCALSGLAPVTEGSATPSPTQLPSVETAVQATVTDESVRVYKLASSTSAKLGTLMWGEQVNVLSVSDGWAYIEKSGNYGFCKSSALTKVTADIEEVPKGYKKGGFKATVIQTKARAYETASESADSVEVKQGTELTVMGYSKDLTWACVSNGASRAFMKINLLSKAKYDIVNSDGSAVQTLLKALMSYGYYDGIPSTSYNSAAITAIKRFQAACGLSQTGEADQNMQRVLYGGYAPACDLLSGTFKAGSSGSDVSRIQMRLYALGYLSKTASLDGSYGDTTTAAIGLFQKARGIEVTGVADTDTLWALYSTTAPSRPSGVKAADDGNASGGSVVSPSGNVTLSSTYVTTMPSQLKSTTSSFSSGMSNALKLEYVIYSAQQKLGCTYVYGATGPSTFDCSGLTQYSFKQAGVSLKRSAYSQGYDTTYEKISSVGSLKRGDLVFFNTISDSDLSDHVGIYLGGGCFIHASSGGHKVVVSNLTSGFYNRVFSWGRRVL